LPGFVAGLVLRLLPESRHDWGEAMLAELDQLERPLARWRFAAGCTRVGLLASEPNPEPGRLGPAMVLAGAIGVLGLAAYSELRSSLNASSGGIGLVYTLAAAAFCLVVLALHTIVALRRVRSATPRAAAGRRYGLVAGAGVGATALLASLPLQQPGVGAVATMAGLFLIAGALAARSSGDYRSGRDAGLWAGIAGGLVLIVGLLTVTFATTGRFAHDPRMVRIYHDSLSPAHVGDHHTHFATLTGFVMAENSDTALVGGLVWLPLLGLAFGSTGGALAGGRLRPVRRPSTNEQHRSQARRAPPFARWPRNAIAALLAVDLTLLGGLAAQGSVLAHPGGGRYLLAPLAAFVAYATAAAVTARKTRARPWLPTAVQVGMMAGAMTGAMWVVSLTVETFAGLSGWPNIAATAPLLLGAFAVWAAAGALAGKRTDSFAAGVLAAVFGAMLCVMITIGFGLTLVYLALPTLARNINGSPEYLASHWNDLHAFAIANTLDAAFQHLLIAPLIAAITGSLSALATHRYPRPARPFQD